MTDGVFLLIGLIGSWITGSTLDLTAAQGLGVEPHAAAATSLMNHRTGSCRGSGSARVSKTSHA